MNCVLPSRKSTTKHWDKARIVRSIARSTVEKYHWRARSAVDELSLPWLFLPETHGQTLLVQVMEGVNENAVLAMQMLLAQDVVYALWHPQLLCTSRVGNCIFKGPLKQFLSFLIEYHLYIQSLSHGMLSLKNYNTILTELQVVRHYPSLNPQHSPSTRILCGHRYVLPLWAQCWVVMRVLPNSSWFELSVFDKHVWWWLPESEVYLQGSCLPWCAVAAVYFPHIPQMQKDECCYTNVLECSIRTIHVSCQKQTSLHLCSFEITPPWSPPVAVATVVWLVSVAFFLTPPLTLYSLTRLR